MRKQHGLKNKTSVVLGWVRDNTNWIATVGAFLLALGVSAAKAAVYLGVGIAIVGALALLPVCIKFFTRQIIQRLPSKKVIILIANFEGPDPQSYRVTETILSNLRRATEMYSDVEIRALERPITEQEGSEAAREEGRKSRAVIVLWGWYGKTQNTVPISINFEILKPPEYLPELGKGVQGQVQEANIADLESFKLQVRLSEEMAYLTLFVLGLYRYEIGDWDGTIFCLTNALEQVRELALTTTQESFYFYRANACLFQENFDQAIADYTQSLNFKPDVAVTYNNRGNAYSDKGNYIQAIADFDQALILKPDFADAYNNRGLAYDTEGDYARAIVDFNQALTLKPDFAMAYYNRGISFGKRGNYDRAIADYTQTLKLQPTFAQALVNRGNSYLQIGDFIKAIADLKKALKLQTNLSEAHYSLAAAYYNQGIAYGKSSNHNRAIASYTKALKLRPSFAEAFCNRGLAYRRYGRNNRALADFNQAIRFQPNLAAAYYNRGLAYLDKGSKQDASDDFKQALHLTKDPEFRQKTEDKLQELGVGGIKNVKCGE